MTFAVTYTVSYTSGLKSKNSLNNQQSWLPRHDLDMEGQRRTAYLDTRNDLQNALVKDYKATIGTRTKHANFLYQILNEVQRYQLCANGNRIPDLALELLAEELAAKMVDNTVDHYAGCLAIISRHRVYSSDFIITANEMVEHTP